MYLSYDPIIPLLRINSKDILEQEHQKCKRIFKTTLFIMVKNKKESKCPLNRINNCDIVIEWGTIKQEELMNSYIC